MGKTQNHKRYKIPLVEIFYALPLASRNYVQKMKKTTLKQTRKKLIKNNCFLIYLCMI